MRKGFTLLEMLVVIGIIAILAGATIAGYAHVLQAGERARAHELVYHAATALTALFEREGVWPKAIRDLGTSGGLLDENIAWYMRNDFSVSVAADATDELTDSSKRKAIGYDRFGIVTPWALAVIKRQGTKAALGTRVNGTSTVKDHILRFAVDLDGDGLIENVSVGGQGKGTKASSVSVRASAIVWCCDKDGKIVDYKTGVKKNGIYSWSYGQTQAVK